MERDLVFLGPGSDPIPGVDVRVGAKRFRSDPSGEVVLHAPRGRRGLRVEYSGPVPMGDVTLTKQRTILHFPDLVPIEVEVRDADTGSLVKAAAVTLECEGSRLALAPKGRRFGARFTPLSRGKLERIQFTVSLPNGYVIEHSRVHESAFVSRFTARVRAVRTDQTGEAVVKGFPILAGEWVTVEATKNGRTGDSRPILLHRNGAPAAARIVLPREEKPRPRRLVAFQGGSFISCGAWPLSSAPTARVAVDVMRRDGSPAVNVLVVVAFRPDGHLGEIGFEDGRTDDRGMATIFVPVSGTAHVAVQEPGFASPRVAVELTRGNRTEVTIREAAGADLSVRVLDADGRPVSAATIKVGLPRYSVGRRRNRHFVFLDGGTQIIGYRTGPKGTLPLPGVPAFPAKVTASFASREATVTATGPGRVVIRLPRAKRAARAGSALSIHPGR